jgi:MFS family permease
MDPKSAESNKDKIDVAAMRKNYILPVITLSTFAGTSLWFAGNAVVRDIQKAWVLGDNLVAYITSSVQVGFIVGTAVFALTGLVDMYPPGRVFCVCCLIGAFFNASIYLFAFGLSQLLVLRFLIGFCLAGIYPVALKIAKGWYDVGLGYAMGCVVCALALGTAFPHLIKGSGGQLPWGATLISVSIFAALGGVAMFLLVPDGPLLKKGAKFNMMMIVEIFREWNYTQASLGYYGHMWEQYSFWGYLPMMIDSFAQVHHLGTVNVSLCTFFAISAGAIGSYVTGWGTKYITNSATATFSISASAVCGIVHPIFYGYPSLFLYMLLLFVWGWNVTSDSPQFSALASRACKPELLGTALTVYNCIGYFMTVLSIQLCQTLAKYITMQYVSLVIAVGPILGAVAIWPRARTEGIWIIPEHWRKPTNQNITFVKEDFVEMHPIPAEVASNVSAIEYDIGAEPEELDRSNLVAALEQDRKSPGV